MEDELSDLLVEQMAIINSIKRSLPNFKKLGKANITLCKAKNRLDRLEILWEQCQRLNVRLLQITTPEKQSVIEYFKTEELYVAEDAYLEAADFLADTIGQFVQRAPESTMTVSNTSFREYSSPVSLQLPRISLPKFSGNFAEWENFRGIYESLVASNESLTRTQKLHYLKASVTGDAALLISHIQIADTNYDAAWKLLVAEYDNQRAIIHIHIQAFNAQSFTFTFADLPAMKTESTAELKTGYRCRVPCSVK